MRLTSLILLAAVVGGVGYVIIFQRDWALGLFKKGAQAAKGYSPAKTPNEAVTKFLKAVKDRDYSSASIYCSKDYADQLVETNTAAREIGTRLDNLNDYIAEKGFTNDKTTQLFSRLDPFPNKLKIGAVNYKEGESKARGGYAPDDIVTAQKVLDPGEWNRLDMRMFVNALSPPIAVLTNFEIKKEGAGEEAQWKLQIPVSADQLNALMYFRKNYKSYCSGLDNLHNEVRQGRFLKETLINEVMTVLEKSK